jgi:hypothetical protein
MMLPKASKTILIDGDSNDGPTGAGWFFFPMTDWLAGVAVREAACLLQLINPTVDDYTVIPGVQMANTDQRAPHAFEFWGSSIDGSDVNAGTSRVFSSFESMEASNPDLTEGTDENFWVRFGVCVKHNSGTSLPVRGEVTAVFQVRS